MGLSRTAPCVASTSGRPFEAAPVTRASLQSHQARTRAPAGQPCPRRRHQHRLVAVAVAEKPDWYRELEAAAKDDDEVARLLAGANGNPDVVQQRLRDEVDSIQARILGTQYAGEDRPMEVSFRAPLDTFNLWLWLELYKPPTPADLEMLQEVLSSWYLLGRLGAFNSTNLQVLYHQDGELEELEYDAEEGAAVPATFHEMQPLEARGAWARFWVDLGTSDELALDALINALTTFSKEQLGIRQLVLGGENEDWAAPQRDDFLPDVTMDPMRGPRRRGGGDWDDEDDEDDEDEFGI